ncbi:hypothetical protein LINPERPRIM_LOCUS21885 [Linum perenne]
MEHQVAQLSLEDDEEELVLEGFTAVPKVNDFSLRLVGFLLTDKNYNFQAFQNTIAGLWRPGRGVSFKDIGSKLMLIRFNHIVNLLRVLELGPWSFDYGLLILH